MLKLGILIEQHQEPNQNTFTATPVFILEGIMTHVAKELTGLYTTNELEEALEVFEFFRERLDNEEPTSENSQAH